MRFLILVAAMLSMTAQAQVLAPTQKSLRVEYAMGKASDLYAGTQKVSDLAATGAYSKRDITNISLLGSHGIGQSSQIDLGIAYGNVDAGSNSRGGIAEVMARYIYEVYGANNFNVDLGVGFRAPGDNRNGNDFFALSDGLTKFDYSVNLGYNLNMFHFGLYSRYTDRNSRDAKPQWLEDFIVSVNPIDRLQIALDYQIFRTSGGLDIGGTGFTGQFSQVKEEYDAIGLAAAYQICQSMIVDARYGKKLDGRNTDDNSTVALGLTTTF